MFTKLKLVLVDDVRKAWKFISVQFAALLLCLDYAFQYLPAIQQYFPAHWVSIIAAGIIVGRLIRQTKKGEQK